MKKKKQAKEAADKRRGDSRKLFDGDTLSVLTSDEGSDGEQPVTWASSAPESAWRARAEREAAFLRKEKSRRKEAEADLAAVQARREEGEAREKELVTNLRQAEASFKSLMARAQEGVNFLNKSIDREKELETTLQQAEEHNLCSICLSAPKNFAFVSCGHLCACQDCMQDCITRGDTRCPICRVTGFWIQVYR